MSRLLVVAILLFTVVLLLEVDAKKKRDWRSEIEEECIRENETSSTEEKPKWKA